jgi:hypothetical protein
VSTVDVYKRISPETYRIVERPTFYFLYLDLENEDLRQVALAQLGSDPRDGYFQTDPKPVPRRLMFVCTSSEHFTGRTIRCSRRHNIGVQRAGC